jgi:hypothetical protein
VRVAKCVDVIGHVGETGDNFGLPFRREGIRRTQKHRSALDTRLQTAYNPVSRHRRIRRDTSPSSNEMALPGARTEPACDEVALRVTSMQSGQSTIEWVIGAAVILGTFAPQRDLSSNQGFRARALFSDLLLAGSRFRQSLR